MEDEKKGLIEKIYLDIIKAKKSLPVYADFLFFDITRDMIRRYYGGIEKLHEEMSIKHRDVFAENFSTINDMFSSEKTVETKLHKKFIITTAVGDSPAHLEFLQALDSYVEKNGGQIVIMPCESITNSFEDKTTVFDSVFNDPKYKVVQQDTKLNENLSLCSIQVSAKQIKSITGLSRLKSREGSFVFAGPKQFLEYLPSGNKRGKNFSIMTPGACTRPKYFSEVFVSKRLSYIADSDHTIGAIIVEIKDDKIFDFRQIQSAEDGSFCDMGILYSADGSAKTVKTNVVLGDLHGIQCDYGALAYFEKKFAMIDIGNLYIHDLFDGMSVSHHMTTPHEKSLRNIKQESSLQEELYKTAELLEYVNQIFQPTSIKVVKSNHDEFLDRYLKEGRYINDPENHLLSLHLAISLFNDVDVLEYALNSTWAGEPLLMSKKVLSKNIEFLSRSSTDLVGDLECGSHGDLGLNGARPSLNSLEKIYGQCVVGHNHTAGIQRRVFRVGTLSKLNMEYNRGPSSWTQTCALVYDNGQVQLINRIPE